MKDDHLGVRSEQRSLPMDMAPCLINVPALLEKLSHLLA